MRIHRSRRIDRGTAERLLDGWPLGTDAGHDALADLLAAAAAPAADGEQVGERAVMAAFWEARRTSDQQSRARPVTTAAPPRLRSAKAIVGAIAATTLCGVAVAAGTGQLPGVRNGSPAVGTGITGTVSGATDRTSATPTVGGTATTTGTDPAATGLCRVYVAADASDRAKLLATSAFSGLLRAAGNKGRVASYCATVLQDGEPGAAGPTAKPGQSKAAKSKQTHGAAASHSSGSSKSNSTASAHAHSTSTSHPGKSG
jgi:hypothetical protein